MKQKTTFLILLVCMAATSVYSQSVRSIENIGIGEFSIIEMVNNNIWAGSPTQGVAYYNSTAQTWTIYNSSTLPPQYFRSDTVTGIVATPSGGSELVLIGTTNGIVENKNGSWDNINVSADHHIAGISLVSDTIIWVSLRDSGLVELDTALNVIQNFTKATSSIPTDQTGVSQQGGRSCAGLCVAIPDSGMLLTYSGTMYFRFDTSVADHHLVNNHINAIWTDNNCGNDSWIVGTVGGLSICRDSLPCQNFTTANGLPENDITVLSQDCRGNIWFGTADSGVAVYLNPGFSRITTSSGLTSNQITAITFAPGSCTGYVATADGNIAVIDTNNQVTQVLGLTDISASDFAVDVYPQPASSRVNFVFGKELSTGGLSLTDISGRSVGYQDISHATKISADVSTLPDGLYFYRLTADGQLLKTGKIDVVR